MPKNYIESTLQEEEPEFEVPLRPEMLNDFIGQQAIKERLLVLIQAAKQRKEPLGHCLLSGPPGLGKTTLAHILSREMGTNLVCTAGPVIEKLGDLAGLLTNLQEGDVLFIDEIHRLNRAVEECLYSAIEDYKLDIMIDSGPSARSVQVKLNQFTLVGATTKTGLLTGPLRSRFAFSCRLEYYDHDILEQILMRTGRLLSMSLGCESAREVAKRARGTPRIANHLLRWVRDYAQIKTEGKVSPKIAQQALEMLAIDEIGLDEMDKKILTVLIDHYQGGPVGVNTLSVAVGEESATLEEVYEPYLILKGLIKRTSRGREATPLAYQHLEKEQPA